LNVDRKQSFFHRGFLESMLNRQATLVSTGPDYESRMWYVAGLIAGCLIRHPDKCLKFVKDGRTTLDELCDDKNIARSQLLIPGLYPVLREGGLLPNAIRLLTNGFHHLNDENHLSLANGILADASDLLRAGDAATSL